MNGGTEEKNRLGFRKALLHFAAHALLLLVVVGMAIRLTARDTFLVTAVPYYATSPAAMTLIMLCAILCLPRTRIPTWRFAIGLFLLAVMWTCFRQYESNSRQNVTGEVRTLMFWNVYAGNWGWGGVVSEIKAQDPDIVALAECWLAEDSRVEFLAKHFPGYEVVFFPRGLTLLSRIPISDTRGLTPPDGGGVFQSATFAAEHPFTLVLGDLPSALSLHRKEPLGVLVDVVDKLDGPVLIAGDLNTPVDSVFCDPLRMQFKNAFEEVGSGLHATWPMPLPVLAIDHVWGNANVAFHHAEIRGTMRSDHRAIVVEFAVGQD